MQTQTNKKYFLFSLLFLLFGVIIFFLLIFLNFNFEANSIFLIFLAPIFIFFDYNFLPKLLIGPYTYIYIYHLLGYSLGPLAQRYMLHVEAYDISGMIKAQYAAIIGLSIFLLTSFFISKKIIIPNNKTTQQLNLSKFKDFTIILVVITIFQLFYSYYSGGIRRIGGDEIQEVSGLTHTIISSFINIQYIVFFFLGFYAFTKKGNWLIFTIFFYLLYSFFYILEGNRGQLVNAFIFLFSGFAWAGLPKIKIFKYFFIFILIFIPLAGMIDVYRSVTTANDYDKGFLSRISAIINTTNDNSDKINKQSSTIFIAPFIYAVSAHTADMIFAKTPSQIPYAEFENMSAPLYAFIPSYFKIKRPDIEDGSFIAAKYGNGFGKGSKSWEYTPTTAEGYRRFGWFGIIIIYFICSLFFILLINFFYKYSHKINYLSCLLVLLLGAPGLWSFTFNYLFFYFFFVFSRYFILFLLIRIVITKRSKQIYEQI